MNFFGIRIGSKKEELAPSPEEAIQKLREIENLLEKKQEYVEQKVLEEISNAKKHGIKNKKAAILALKRKKRYESELQAIDGKLINLECQREALESVGTNMAIMESMKLASEALKLAHKKMNVDELNEIMDEIAEQHELSREISEVVSNSFGFNNDVDIDELENELEDLNQELLDEELKTSQLNLPAVSNETFVKISSKQTPPLEDKKMSDLGVLLS